MTSICRATKWSAAITSIDGSNTFKKQNVRDSNNKGNLAELQ